MFPKTNQNYDKKRKSMRQGGRLQKILKTITFIEDGSRLDDGRIILIGSFAYGSKRQQQQKQKQ